MKRKKSVRTAGSSGRRSRSLEARLKERIGREGPLSYEAFAEAVLYDERQGYYRKGKQEGRDYSTSPEIHSLFGRTIGRYIEKVCDLMGVSSATVLELGGASGRLASHIVSAFRRLHLESYLILEKGREKREGRVRWIKDLESLPAIDGFTFVVANEFFDALPFRKVINRQGTLEEIYVGWEDGFFERSGPPTAALSAFLERYPLFLHEGQVSEVTTAARPLVRAVSRIAKEGCLLVFDYGYHQADIAAGRFFEGSALGYKRRRIRSDFFKGLGAMDITHHVNFDHLRGLLEDEGWRSEGEIEQYRFLCNAGLLEGLAGLEPGERMRAKWLINPEGLGAMVSVLGFSKGLSLPMPGLGRPS